MVQDARHLACILIVARQVIPLLCPYHLYQSCLWERGIELRFYRCSLPACKKHQQQFVHEETVHLTLVWMRSFAMKMIAPQRVGECDVMALILLYAARWYSCSALRMRPASWITLDIRSTCCSTLLMPGHNCFCLVPIKSCKKGEREGKSGNCVKFFNNPF